MKARQVVWQTNADVYAFEHEYICDVLLADVPGERTFDGGYYQKLHDDALIVYSCDQMRVDNGLIDYLKRLESYSLLHLSNEHLRHDWAYYESAKIVLRSYFDPSIDAGNTYAIPLGFQSGFLTNREFLDDQANRRYVWSFAGQLKNDRHAMTAAVLDLLASP